MKISRLQFKRLFTGIVLALVVAELLLVLVSWLVSATMGVGVRSLLSAEGVRWFAGGFVSMLAGQSLVWLLLLSMAGGCLWQSGILADLSVRTSIRNYRQRIALRTTVAFLVAYVGCVLLLTLTPHALLLSATGSLFPSPFSRAIVPIVAFALLSSSTIYGRLSGRFISLSDILASLSYGVSRAAPLFILYVLVVQLYNSLRFTLFLDIV